jgi:hypothetical protein
MVDKVINITDTETLLRSLRDTETILQGYNNDRNTISSVKLKEIYEDLSMVLEALHNVCACENIHVLIGSKALQQLKLVLALYIYVPNSESTKEEIREAIRRYSYWSEVARV